MTKLQFIIILVGIFLILIGTIGHMMNHSYGDLLPPIGKWTSCANLPETCDVPEYETSNLSDLVIFRFENGSMIVRDMTGSPIVK